MSQPKTIFWHDYETWGSNPRRDRPCQFAGIRTDEALNICADPVELFCQPAPDFLPSPVACRVTGISPITARERGLVEAEFCRRIAGEFSEPGTCVAGYNSLRFDDEVTRFMLYRNFRDPYEREWKNGNSRWDIIDLMRMTRALRPEGIHWPDNEDGSPSFRLEALTAANGIDHADAHDALADVRATIAMAALVREAQPKLYDYYFALRSKHRVLPLLDLQAQEPVVHVSGMFPAERGRIGIVLPLIKHPVNNNGIIVVDLLEDPGHWLGLDAAQIRERVFTSREALGEDEQRAALKTVHLNRCPALAPLSVLTDSVTGRYGLDLDLVAQRREQVLAAPDLATRLRSVFAEPDLPAEKDPDLMLYSGGFFDDHDRKLMQSLQYMPATDLAGLAGRFHDARLDPLLFRYRARNYPESLSAAEQAQWREHCARQLTAADKGENGVAGFEAALEAEREQLPGPVHSDLRAYADGLYRWLAISP